MTLPPRRPLPRRIVPEASPTEGPFFEADRELPYSAVNDQPVELRRPTVDELEVILQREDGPPVALRSDGTVHIDDMQQPEPELVETVDELAHLPDHVRAEVEAGKKAVVTSMGRAELEQAVGKKAREHHEALAKRPKPQVTPESIPLPPNQKYVNMYDRKMSPQFLAGGQTPTNVVK